MVQTGVERADKTVINTTTGDVIVSYADKVHVVDQLTGNVDQTSTAVVINNETTMQSTSQLTSTYDMGILSEKKDASYEVINNVDGTLVSTGGMQATMTADKLTGTVTSEVSRVHDEAGVVSQERAVIAKVEEDGIVATVANQ